MIENIVYRLYVLWLVPHLGCLLFLSMFRMFSQHYQAIDKQGTISIEPMDADQIVKFELEDVEESKWREKLSLTGRLFLENPPSLKTIRWIEFDLLSSLY
ncbi:unnamed protein product [Linum trigynum]|uniref:Uncharacterized protein n=1 Tax=Linum trigynum TaxID=586398 RepID=A0AAV2CD22_9ROSI